uniref:WD repeat-containing protein 11 n=2 Tax=Ascaris TaxID=6251 RepID=A0A9J2NZE4_ASCLU
MPLILPGSLHPSNKDAIAWNEKGLLAYGSHCTLIVVDCMRKKIIQTLEKHSAAISHVSWAPEGDAVPVSEMQLRCASADISGFIVVWNVLEGAPLSSFRHLNSAPLSIAWYPWEDASSDFLLALHGPSTLALWNTATGDRIWNVLYVSQVCLFTLDPFDSAHLAFGLSDGSLFLVDDVILHKAPTGQGCSLNVLRNRASIVQVQYHNAYPNILFAASSTEIVCVETECRCVIWHHVCESTLLRLLSCSDRDAIFTVHASGSVVLRISHVTEDAKGNSRLSYERVQCFETQRQSAHHRISGTAICPITQSTFAFLYNSGRVAFYQLSGNEAHGLRTYRARFITDMLGVDSSLHCSPLGILKLSNVGEMFSLGQSASSVRMRPMDTLEGEHALHLAAIGSNQGMIHMVNVFTATIQKELHVHTCPIKCLDWGGPHTLISAAYAHSLSTSPLVKNDIFVTDIRTGESKRLRPEVEETPVEMLRVSFYHCYVAIGFRSEPLEIWHLKSMRLLRRMSRACPVIVDMAWSGKHHAMRKVIGGVEPVFRENLVVLDQDCHLYHVVVKGLHVRDGKEVNSQWKSGVASMKSLVWKDDLLAMGDSSGRLGVWDLGRRQCKQTSGSPRGPIIKMTFSRLNGDHTLAVLHSNAVFLWDADQLTVLQQLNFGSSLTLVDLDLCGVCPILLCSDNSFRYVPSSSFNMPLHQRDMPEILRADALNLLVENNGPEPAMMPLIELFSESLNFCSASNPSTEESINKTGGRVQQDSEGESVNYCGKKQEGDVIRVSDCVDVSPSKSDDNGGLVDVSGVEVVDGIGQDHERKTGCSADSVGESNEIRQHVSRKAKCSNFDRYRVAHRVLGNRWLYDFWTVSQSVLTNIQLPPSLCTFWPAEMAKRRVELLLSCLMNVPELTPAQIDVLVQRAREWAIQMLLGAREECRASALRACLLAAEVSSEGAQSIIKLVATNLIANNCIADGIQMLFLIRHGEDACRYLQAHGSWEASLAFAKIGLDEYTEVGIKWLEHLIASNSRKNLSCLLAASLGEWDRALTLLWANSRRDTARQLLDALRAESVPIKESTVQLITGGLRTVSNEQENTSAENAF